MLKGIGSKSDAVNLMPELKQKLNYEFKVTAICANSIKNLAENGMWTKKIILVTVFKDAVFH